MEYAKKGDLLELIKRSKDKNKYVKEQTVWNFASQILEALENLHQHSIVHRDIKPQNVFLTSDMVLKLGDFGVSRNTHGKMIQSNAGTPMFLAPE